MSGNTAILNPTRNLLVVAHPGHELRVFHWAQQQRPAVFILTDGSGSLGEGRLDQTEEVLRAADARRAGWLELLPDKDVYRLILEGNAARFAALTRELADYIVEHKIEVVAGDMIEGYSPSHDLCRNFINAAVELAACRGHAVRRNLAFPLIGRPDAGNNLRPAEVLKLDPLAFHKKYETAMNYRALRHEVEAAFKIAGKEAFATEVFYDAEPLGDAPVEIPPYYEQHGKERVLAGHYERIIRFRDHVQPLVAGLRSALGLRA